MASYVRHLFFIFCVSSFLSSHAGMEKPELTYVYNENTDGYDLQTKWLIEVSSEGLAIEGINSIAKTFIDFTKDYTLEKFAYQANAAGFHYVLQRDGEHLYVEGSMGDGKIRKKNHKIGNLAWIQEFGFGLHSFLASSQKEFKFCIVNPKDLSVVKMVAKKKNIESLNVNNREFDAQRVYVTLQGWKSAFWSADVWYDAKSHDLLLYKADQGPNTPFTVVTLLSKETVSN